MKKWVIDANTNQIIEKFDKEDTEIVLEKYRSLLKWNDIGVDIDGDVILND